MASGKVLKPTSTTAYSTTLSTGTSNAQMLGGSILKIGKLVLVSARVKAVNAIADAMNTPLVLCPYTPKQVNSSITSMACIEGNPYVYAGLILLKQFGSSYYACQTITGNLVANAEIDMLFAYETED